MVIYIDGILLRKNRSMMGWRSASYIKYGVLQGMYNGMHKYKTMSTKDVSKSKTVLVVGGSRSVIVLLKRYKSSYPSTYVW